MTLEPRMWIADCTKCNGRWAGHVKPAYSNPVEYVCSDDVEALISAAIAAEREACAKIAEAWESCNNDGCASSIVDAIRARNP